MDLALEITNLSNLVRIQGGPLNAIVAQIVEQWTENPRVVGAVPTVGTK